MVNWKSRKRGSYSLLSGWVINSLGIQCCINLNYFHIFYNNARYKVLRTLLNDTINLNILKLANIIKFGLVTCLKYYICFAAKSCYFREQVLPKLKVKPKHPLKIKINTLLTISLGIIIKTRNSLLQLPVQSLKNIFQLSTFKIYHIAPLSLYIYSSLHAI